MRIAYLLADPGIGVFGTKGASVHVQEVVRALRAEGHEVTVFCSRRDDEVPPDLADLRVVRIPVPSVKDTADRERAIGATARQLAAAAATESFDLVYERYSLFSAAGADLADALGALLVVEVNAPLVDEQRDHRHLVDEAGAWSTSSRLLERADLVSCVSRPVADWVETSFPTAAAHRPPVVIPNGVNTARITPWVGESPTGPPTIGFVGTLKPWHGTDLLLRAVAGMSTGVTVDICGTGPEQSTLERLATELGIADRVRFRGAVPPTAMPAILRGLDIAVAPYPPGDHYFSPLKVYEYLAAGLPIVASAIGSLPDLLEHGRAGVLVPPGDVAALTEALTLLATDPQRRATLGRRARELAETEHDWRRRCGETLALVGARA